MYQLRLAMLLALLCTVAGPAVAQCVEPPAGLVAWWTADGTASDYVGPHHGALLGNADYGAGHVYEAFDLQSQGDFVKVPDADDLDDTAELTIELWAYFRDFGGPDCGTECTPLVTKWDSVYGPENAFFLVEKGGTLFFQVENSAFTDWVEFSHSMQLDTWHHIAAVFNAGTAELFVDGSSLGSGPIDVTFIRNATEPVRIGGWYTEKDPAYRDFNGLLDEVSIYRAALSSSEIAAISSAGEFGKCTADQDGDNFPDREDCDDSDAAVFPGAAEVCDLIDNDCDGTVDETPPPRTAADPEPETGADFGQSVAGLGDVSGDGTEDYAVGAPKDANTVGGLAGSVVVYSGADDSVICRALPPEADPDGALGFSLARLADLTGDGKDDFVAGWYRADRPPKYSGAAVVFSAEDCSHLFTLDDPQVVSDSWLGYSVMDAGDLSGDGTTDIVVGKPHRSDPGTPAQYPGEVLVFSGSNGELLDRFSDPLGGDDDGLGYSISSAGDLNGDLVPDILAGSPRKVDGLRLGRAVVFSGADGSVLLRVSDGAANLGIAVAGGEDFNGDGTPDIVATKKDDQRGVVFSGADGSVLWELAEPAPIVGAFGDRITLVPDADQDGTRDVLLGRPLFDDGLGPGRVGRTLLFSGADGTLLREYRDPTPEDGERFGSNVGFSEVTGDGRADHLVGATDSDVDGTAQAGSVVVFPTDSWLAGDCDSDGFTPEEGDCDDYDPTISPSESEIFCDGVDQNCNGLGDESPDADGDSFNVCGPGNVLDPDGKPADCNDANPSINPDATEICDEVDQDCNGLIDDDESGEDSDEDGVRNVCDNCRDAYNPGQENSDNDSLGNACDNCFLVANEEQLNTDGDSKGDACDNCPELQSENFDDIDEDGWGDVCDNCLDVENFSQHDLDADNQGDECDYDDGVVIFERIRKNRVFWQSDPAFAVYNLYRGSLDWLRDTGEHSQAPGITPYSEAFCSLPDTRQDDPLVPFVGEALYWLVTGETVLGDESALGDGTPLDRTNDYPCP